jgi:NADH-quinone oxidoreductase subunit E
MDQEYPKESEKILLNVLKEEQKKHGYLSEHVLKQISIDHDIPLTRLYGIATFYTMFKTKPQGKYTIEFCGSPSCVLNGSVPIEKFLESELKIKVGETTNDGLFSLYKTSCIGCCNEAPAMLINGHPHTKLTIERVRTILKKFRKEAK